MFYMKHWNQNEWTRRGKKYKAATLSALAQLYGGLNDTDSQFQETKEEKEQSRTAGTHQVCDLVEETKL